MNRFIPKKLRRMAPYVPNDANYRVRLDANESYHPLSDRVRRDIIHRIEDVMFNRYPDPSCTDLINVYSEHIGVDGQYIVAGNGSDELIGLIISSLLKEGDTLLICEPDFSMYEFYADLAGVEVVCCRKDKDFAIDFEEVHELVFDTDANLVIFSNPCNPTGQGVDREEVLDFVRNTTALVVLDEAYMDFWGIEHSLIKDAPGMDNLIVLRTLSKAIGLACLRVGFAISNKELIDALYKAKSPFNMNALSQVAACEVLKHPRLLEEQTALILYTKGVLETGLNNVVRDGACVIPTKTNFLLIEDDLAPEVFDYLLEKGIAVRLSIARRYLRITVGSLRENEELLRALDMYYGGRSCDKQK